MIIPNIENARELQGKANKDMILSKDDFSPDYMFVDKYPRIISWILNKQMTRGDVSFDITIMQKKESESSPEIFIASVTMTKMDEESNGHRMSRMRNFPPAQSFEKAIELACRWIDESDDV